MKWFKQGIGGEVGWEMSGDSMFQYFRQTGEVGNWKWKLVMTSDLVQVS